MFGLKREEILTVQKWRDLEDVTLIKMIRYRDKYSTRIQPGDPRTDKVTGRKNKDWKEEEMELVIIGDRTLV